MINWTKHTSDVNQNHDKDDNIIFSKGMTFLSLLNDIETTEMIVLVSGADMLM